MYEQITYEVDDRILTIGLDRPERLNAAFLEKRPASFPGKVSRDLPDFFPWWESRQFE